MEKLLRYLNRYYPRSIESVTSVVADGLEGNFTERYVVGQYVMLMGTIMSDGIYQLTGVSPTKLTVGEPLTAESDDLIAVVGLSIPKEIIALNAKIEAYKGSEGLASESIDDYSVSFKDGSGWQVAYAKELQAYRVMYSDLTPFLGKYRWQDRWC